MSVYKGSSIEGDRAKTLLKAREAQKERLDEYKSKLEEETKRVGQSMQSKFSSTTSTVEQKIRTNTYGLVTLDEMKTIRQAAEEEHERAIATREREEKEKKDKAGKKKRAEKGVLSFSMDGEEEEEDDAAEKARLEKKRRLGKNPEVDTSFLPDKDREAAEKEERERLRREFLEQQAAAKAEEIHITYSYWDGSGHRRSIIMKKGNTIYEFLQGCVKDLRNEFHELRAVTAEQLIYVKEDLIMPQHMSFYDFIITKARGKSGPLFNFDVHDDVRLIADSTIEKDESHAGKVILRSWYERHKHIFPASRWEPYDPNKKWDKYTISDKDKAEKEKEKEKKV